MVAIRWRIRRSSDIAEEDTVSDSEILERRRILESLGRSSEPVLTKLEKENAAASRAVDKFAADTAAADKAAQEVTTPATTGPHCNGVS
jgi:hypothetical protein